MDEINLENVIPNNETQVQENIDETDRSKTVSAKYRKRHNTEIIEVYPQNYAENRNIAEGMMDLALLTANANQLRFLITYNSKSSTFYVSLGLIIMSLVLQVSVGIALIFKRKNLKKSRMIRTNQFLVGGVFMVTFINILVAAFTSIDNTGNKV